MRLPPLLTPILLVVLTKAAPAQTRPTLSPLTRQFVVEDAPVIALRHVRLIDGTGAPVRDNQTVVLTDGRITAVGDDALVAVPPGAKVHDLTGTTLIPGLYDLHAHQYFYSNAGLTQMAVSAPRLYLGGGITTVRTAGAQMPYDEINTKRDIDRGLAPGPRIHLSGPYLDGPDPGPGRERRLETPEEARRVVAYLAGEGVTWLKFSGGVTRAVLGAAIEEAHKHQMGVTGHLCSVSFREAAALGIDNLEHGFITNSDWVPDREPDRCSSKNMRIQADVDVDSPAVDSTIHELLARKVALTSTLSVYELFVTGRAKVTPEALEMIAPAPRAAVLAELDATNKGNGFVSPRLFLKMMRFERKWVQAGGLLAAGVDPWGTGSLPGFGDHRNYELLIEAGFSPAEAIKIMSANGAQVLREINQRGTITVGKQADLVILDGDLSAAPGIIRNVRLVFKDGIGYDAPKLRASAKGMVGIQ